MITSRTHCRLPPSAQPQHHVAVPPPPPPPPPGSPPPASAFSSLPPLSVLVLLGATITTLAGSFVAFVLYLRPVLAASERAAAAAERAALEMEAAAQEMEKAAKMMQEDMPLTFQDMQRTSKECELVKGRAVEVGGLLGCMQKLCCCVEHRSEVVASQGPVACRAPAPIKIKPLNQAANCSSLLLAVEILGGPRCRGVEWEAPAAGLLRVQ